MSCSRFIERNLKVIILGVIFFVCVASAMTFLLIGATNANETFKTVGCIILGCTVIYGIFAIAYTSCGDVPISQTIYV